MDEIFKKIEEIAQYVKVDRVMTLEGERWIVFCSLINNPIPLVCMDFSIEVAFRQTLQLIKEILESENV